MHGSQWMGLNESVNPFFFLPLGPGVFPIPTHPNKPHTSLHTHTLSLNPPPPSFQILNRQGLGGSERVGHQTEAFWPLDFIKKKKLKKKKIHVPPPHFVSFGGGGGGGCGLALHHFRLQALSNFFFFYFWVVDWDFEDSVYLAILLSTAFGQQQQSSTELGLNDVIDIETLDHICYAYTYITKD